MRTNYILIDFENVQPESLKRLAQGYFKVLVFVGANQTKLPFEIAASLQQFGERAEYVKIAGVGRNALDFHIAYYVGKLAAVEPSAYFHIISKDTGFDPLIQHLRLNKVLVDRVGSVADIPVIKSSSLKSPEERIEVVVAKLQQVKAAKPRTVKTLSSTIAALFQKTLSEQEVQAVVEALVSRGWLSITDTKVVYSLPSPG